MRIGAAIAGAYALGPGDNKGRSRAPETNEVVGRAPAVVVELSGRTSDRRPQTDLPSPVDRPATVEPPRPDVVRAPDDATAVARPVIGRAGNNGPLEGRPAVGGGDTRLVDGRSAEGRSGGGRGSVDAALQRAFGPDVAPPGLGGTGLSGTGLGGTGLGGPALDGLGLGRTRQAETPDPAAARRDAARSAAPPAAPQSPGATETSAAPEPTDPGAARRDAARNAAPNITDALAKPEPDATRQFTASAVSEAPSATTTVRSAPDAARGEAVTGRSAPDAATAETSTAANRAQSEAADEPNRPTGPGGEPLTDEQVREVQTLEARDREVRAHEQAHKVAAGGYAGAIHYDYQTGPDKKRYAVGGHVPIDMSEIPGDPNATAQKMRTIRRAALAPAEPSSQDRRVAAEASRKETEALREARVEQSESLRGRNVDAMPGGARQADATSGGIQVDAAGAGQADATSGGIQVDAARAALINAAAQSESSSSGIRSAQLNSHIRRAYRV